MLNARLAVAFVLLLNAGPALAEAAPPNHAASNQVAAQGPREPSPESREAKATEVIANYTIKLAWLTGVLAGIGIVTSGLTLWQILLARSEFIATFRPKLVVRFVQGPVYSGPDSDGGATAFITFANVGSSDARIVAVGSCLAVREKGVWKPPGLMASPTPIPEVILSPGDRHTITIKGVSGEEGEGVSFLWGFMSAINPDNPEGEICAVGEVQYLDKNGLRRQTGFIRVYDFRRESWRPDKESELEYCD